MLTRLTCVSCDHIWVADEDDAPYFCPSCGAKAFKRDRRTGNHPHPKIVCTCGATIQLHGNENSCLHCYNIYDYEGNCINIDYAVGYSANGQVYLGEKFSTFKEAWNSASGRFKVYRRFWDRPVYHKGAEIIAYEPVVPKNRNNS